MAKNFFMQKLAVPQGPCGQLLGVLRHNPGVSASARVVSNNHRYVHENSTNLELTVEGELASGEYAEDAIGELINQVQEEMSDWVSDMNHKIKRDLESELEYQQGDEAIADSLDANERYFDQEGNEVDLTDFVTADQLPAHVQMKLVKQHTDLFNTQPQQVIQDLTRRGIMFDQAGEQVDVTQFKKVSQLEGTVKQQVLDKFRDWNTQDNSWAESSIEFFKEQLEAFGFRRVEVRYSLGGMQGDGASFTSDSVAVEQFLNKVIEKKKVESQAAVLVKELLV